MPPHFLPEIASLDIRLKTPAPLSLYSCSPIPSASCLLFPVSYFGFPGRIPRSDSQAGLMSGLLIGTLAPHSPGPKSWIHPSLPSRMASTIWWTEHLLSTAIAFTADLICLTNPASPRSAELIMGEDSNAICNWPRDKTCLVLHVVVTWIFIQSNHTYKQSQNRYMVISILSVQYWWGRNKYLSVGPNILTGWNISSRWYVSPGRCRALRWYIPFQLFLKLLKVFISDK